MTHAFTLLSALALAVSPESATGGAPGQEKSSSSEATDTERSAERAVAALPTGAISRLGTTGLRYYSDIRHVAFSPNGQVLACGHGGRGVWFFNSVTGERVMMAAGQDACSPIAFSRNSNLVVMGGALGYTHFLDLSTNKEERVYFNLRCTSLAVSPDGSLLAIGTSGLVLLVDLKTRAVKHRLEVLKGGVYALAFSPDGKLLVAGGSEHLSPDPAIRLWDVSTGKLVGRLEGHEDMVESVAFILGGNTLVSVGLDKTIRFWNVTKRTQIASIETPVNALVASPDGKSLATSAHGSREVTIWDAATRKRTRTLTASCSVNTLAFSPDGNRLLTAGYSPRMQLWDLATEQEALGQSGHEYAVTAVAFSPDGRTLASRSDGRTVRLWDLASKKERLQLQVCDEVNPSDSRGANALAFSPDGTRLVARGLARTRPDRPDATFHLWELSSGKKIASFADPRWPANGLAFPPGGEFIVSADPYGVRFWSLDSHKVFRSLLGSPPTGALSVGFSPDGRTVAGGLSTREGMNNLYLWYWTTGEQLGSWAAQPRQVVSLAFSPGGHILATCGGKITGGFADPIINVWETASGTLIRQLKGHVGAVACVSLSPDGRILASAGMEDKTVRLWDVFSGKELAKLEGHEGPVLTVAFSQDGKLLASGSGDTTILLWEMSRFRAKPPPATDAKVIAKLWTDLNGRDPSRPFQALWEAVGHGDEAVAELRRHLKPVAAPEEQAVRQLLVKLDDNDFQLRSTASKELARLGPIIEPMLRKALDGKPSVEAQRQLRRILSQFHEWPAPDEELRQSRALLTLELIGSSPAKEVLQELGKGADRAKLTRDAKATLDRLNRRAAAK
jgi:WD40 repeat protein